MQDHGCLDAYTFVFCVYDICQITDTAAAFPPPPLPLTTESSIIGKLLNKLSGVHVLYTCFYNTIQERNERDVGHVLDAPLSIVERPNFAWIAKNLAGRA